MSIEEKKEPTGQETQCAQELEALKQSYGYLQADFANYKRRTEQDRIAWMDIAKKELLFDLLSIVDDFDRALTYQSNMQDGLELIYKSCKKLLEKYKVQEISFQKNFDPEKHEALMTVESPDCASGDIVAYVQKGFMYKDTVLRPAKVSVAQ